jgi:hypothetical protein
MNHTSGPGRQSQIWIRWCVGTVRFGDDSVAQTEGSSSVLFVCKNGEHQMSVGVYDILTPQDELRHPHQGRVDEHS